MKSQLFIGNCPINEVTADGIVVGRCWFKLDDDDKCPRHGDVSAAVKRYTETGRLTMETEHDPSLKAAIERNKSKEMRKAVRS